MKIFISFILLILAISVSLLFCSQNQQNKNENKEIRTNYVPNEKVARQVAEVILVSIYGQEIKSQIPFNVKLQGDSLWIITGVQKEVEIGGVAYIEIQKSDCKILNVTHGK